MKIKNDELLAVGDIVEQMLEPRPLPMGRAEFEEWSNRIIAGALIPSTDEDKEAFIKSQKFALANMVLHLGPTESHKPDAFFIHHLRKVCINQVCNQMAVEIKKEFESKRGPATTATGPTLVPKSEVVASDIS